MSEQIWGQGHDKLAFSSNKPNIQYLYDELHRSLFYGGNMSRLTTSDDQRMCRWEGQSSDGKKHEQHLGFEPFPFEGASDVRTRLIDTTINQLVTLLITSWQKANIKVNGIEVDDDDVCIEVESKFDETEVKEPELIRYNSFAKINVQKFLHIKNIFRTVKTGDTMHLKCGSRVNPNTYNTITFEVGVKGWGIERNSIFREGVKLLDGKN